MALTFPRDLPELAGNRLPFAQCEFTPLYSQSVAPFRGGLVQVINLAEDLWQMSYSTVPLDYQDAMELMAWLHSLRGGARQFKAWHPLRRYPYVYPNGFGAMTRAGGGVFDGTCTLSAIAGPRDTITLTTLPAGFVVSLGDFVSFPMGSSQVLVRVIEAATASGLGSVTLTIEPTIPLAATAGVTATLVKPWCLGVVDAKSIRGPLRKGYSESVQFSAVQTY